MSEEVIARTRFERSDYYDIGLIILFSLYAYWFLDSASATFGNSEISRETQGSSYIAWIVPLIVFAWTLFRSKPNNVTPDSNLGFTLGKQCWKHVGIILVVEMLVVYGAWEYLSFTLESFILLACVIMNIVAAVIVLRSLLIELVLKILGKGTINFYLAGIFSTLLFIIVMTDLNSFSIITIVGFSASAFLYIDARCILVPLTWDTFRLIKNSNDSLIIPFIILTFLLYFALTIPVHIIQKRKLKGKSITTTEIT